MLAWVMNLGFAGSGADVVAGAASFETRFDEPERRWSTQWRRPLDNWRSFFRRQGYGFGV